MEKSNSNDEQLKALEAVKKHLGRISDNANVIADELQHLLQPTFPVNKHFIKNYSQVLKWLLQPVVPTETKNIDFGAMSGYGVEPHTVFSFFCCNTMNPNIQRWARWLLVLLDDIGKVDWANETRPSKEHIEAWREATDLMNQSIQRIIKEDFCKFGGQKSHLEEFIDELIAGPRDKRLTQEEFALLDACLKQPIFPSTLQQENQQKAYSQSEQNLNKLKFIRDYNMQLLSVLEIDNGNNSTAESIMTIPDIKEITEIIEKIVQLQTKKRRGQCGNTSSQTDLWSIEKFWPDKYKLFNDSDNWPSRAHRFIAEVEDPKGGETWPPDIQSLIEDVSINMAPWQDCIDRYGPEKLRNQKEIELLLFAVNPAELTWVIRELKKFRKLVVTKLKQPATDNFLPGTTTTSGKRSAIVSRNKSNKSPHDENPKKYRPWASCGDACFIIEDNRIKFHYKDEIKNLRLKSESRTHKMLFLLKTGSLQSNEIKDKLCSAKTKPSKIVAYANKTLNEKIAMVGFVGVPKAVQYIKYDKVYSSYHSALKIWLKEDFDRQELQQPLVDDRKFNAKESY